MDTLRVFIEWCESIDAVRSGLSRKVRSPKIEGGAARDEYLPGDRAERILDHMAKFQYGTTPHVCWVILTTTGMRLGALRALDVGDYKPNGDPAHLDIRYRPGTDTPLKNKRRGERPVVITEDVCSVIEDYLQVHRPDVTDEHDREPLLATAHGRVGKSTVRRYIYKWSRPCEIGRACPHDRDPTECEAAVDLDQAAACPSSVTPHPIRRGYITQLLQSGAPPDLVSGRCDVSPDNIEKHYDVRSKQDKMRQRQHVLKDLQDDESPYL
jgi:integrase